MRVPQTISNRSRIWSRSRKQYQRSEIAPSSSAPVPSQIRCEWMRVSSQRSVRIQVAFGGTSIARSFSIARTKTSSLYWKET